MFSSCHFFMTLPRRYSLEFLRFSRGINWYIDGFQLSFFYDGAKEREKVLFGPALSGLRRKG